MEKLKANRDIDSALDKLMRNELGPHSCQLLEKDNGMKPYASGVLAMLGEKHYILTASHVVNDWSDEHPLFLKTHKGYVSIVGDKRETDIEKSNGIDLAYILLDERVVPSIKAGHKFLSFSKFRGRAKLLDAALYCVIGFPEINQKIENGVLKTGASGYFLQPCKPQVYDHYKLNPVTHFALEMKGKGTDIKTGEIVKFNTEHHGLSGCGLWLVIINYTEEVYTTDFRLIGIMTEFRKGRYHCLIGNRIDILLGALKAYENLNFLQKPYTKQE
jgi:hypothetical protein